MHNYPTGRKFGGPEIALIAVALAFAIPMTAWWHGLYQQPEPPLTDSQFTRASAQAPTVVDATNSARFAFVGYVINISPADNTIALPALHSPNNPIVVSQTPMTDPNQILLLVIAVLGTVTAGVYSMGVYPALRR